MQQQIFVKSSLKKNESLEFMKRLLKTMCIKKLFVFVSLGTENMRAKGHKSQNLKSLNGRLKWYKLRIIFDQYIE